MAKTRTRRKFVAGVGTLAAGAILAACGSSTATNTVGPIATVAPTKPANTVAPAANTAASSAVKAAWGYEGATGPDKWGTLDASYAVCSTGKKQSPIDIPATTGASSFKSFETSYRETPVHIENKGYTIELEYETGSTLVIDGKKYELLQFHFHSPSEHKIAGKQYGMEVHFVHKATDTDYAVIGIMFEEGAENPFLTKFWDKVPSKKGKEEFKQSINGSEVFPTAKQYFTYDGSLTTPGCSEVVRWIVLKNPVTASKAQMDKFVSIIGKDARPVQPLNDRQVGAG